MTYWKILRVLVTNQCNYNCVYCHNEGQSKDDLAIHKDFLSFKQFANVFRAIKDTDIREIRFSGGEPLLNPDIFKMIEMVSANKKYEIGIATNGSRIDKMTALQLHNNNVLVTIHLPGVGDQEYAEITGKRFEQLTKSIQILDEEKVTYSFNFVVCENTLNHIDSVIDYVINHKKRIKFLPYIDISKKQESTNLLIKKLAEKLNKICYSREILKDCGIVFFTHKSGAQFKLILTPCESGNMLFCKQYAEIRLLPNMMLQPCIFSNYKVSIIDMESDDITLQLNQLWQNFTVCLKP